MKKSLYIVAAASILSACDSKDKEFQKHVAELEANVIKWHDDVMIQTGEAESLKKELGKIHFETVEDSLAIAKNRLDLTEANDEMMGWMAQFKIQDRPYDSTSYEYYHMQLSSIKMVGEQTSTAIRNAQKYLNE